MVKLCRRSEFYETVLWFLKIILVQEELIQQTFKKINNPPQKVTLLYLDLDNFENMSFDSVFHLIKYFGSLKVAICLLQLNLEVLYKSYSKLGIGSRKPLHDPYFHFKLQTQKEIEYELKKTQYELQETARFN